jgi:hypothetical protein
MVSLSLEVHQLVVFFHIKKNEPQVAPIQVWGYGNDSVGNDTITAIPRDLKWNSLIWSFHYQPIRIQNEL